MLVAASSAMARFTPAPCRNAFTPEQEIVEGQKAKAQIYGSLPVLPDSSPISEYVRGIGERLVAEAPLTVNGGYRWPFEFHVVELAEINAFALPGGPVFINLGTIRAAGTEAQLAGVMAHEISHVVQRHSTCSLTKQQNPGAWLGLGQMAAGILLPGAAGALASMGIGFGGQTIFLHMSRDAEKQADLMGTDILYDAGYDPRGLPQFFEVIEGQSGGKSGAGAQWLSDHPNPGNRIDYVQDEIEALPRKTDAVRNTAEFKDIQKQALTMRVYTVAEVQSGAWRSTAPNEPVPGVPTFAGTVSKPVDFNPSATYKALETPQYTVGYPDNWQAEVTEGSATIAPRGGVVREGTRKSDSDSIVYGVTIDSYLPQINGSLATNFEELVKNILHENAGLRQAGGAEDLVVNRAPARGMQLMGVSPMMRGSSPAEERDWLVAVARPDGSLSYLIFVAPAADAPVLKPVFEQMLRTFVVKD
jgi:hypothetical protein